MSRIIMFSHRPIFQKELVSGPGIRVFEIAKALQKKGHFVCIAEPERKKKEIKEKINFISWDDKLLNNIEKKYDITILQTWNDEIDFLNKLTKIPKVVDLYSPTLIEHANFCTTKTKYESYYKKGTVDYFYDDVIMNLSRIIHASDFFICANQKQKAYYTGIFSILGKINPENYKQKIIEIVPFGISKKEPNKKIKGLKIKNEKDDILLLWPGGIFPWFDATTLIKAMKIIVKKNSKIKLVFVGANNPFDSHFTKQGFEQAKKLAKKLNLLDVNIFFHDWIPFSKRELMYNEAQIAIILAKKGFENEISHRTRIIDCIWGEIPIITTIDSAVSDIIHKKNLGLIVTENNEKEITKKIVELINNKELRNKIINNIQHYKKEFFWNNMIKPLHLFCQKPAFCKQNKFNIYNLLNEKQKSVKICENQLVIKNEELIIKNKQINEKDKQINEKDKQINKKDKQIKNFFKIINNQKEIIIKQKSIIIQFRNSIVFPFYKLTSKTGFILKKILK